MTIPQVAETMLDAGMSITEAQDAIRKEFIEAALRRTKGNVKKAAQLVQIHRNNLSKHLVRYGINSKTFRYPTRARTAAAG